MHRVVQQATRRALEAGKIREEVKYEESFNFAGLVWHFRLATWLAQEKTGRGRLSSGRANEAVLV